MERHLNCLHRGVRFSSWVVLGRLGRVLVFRGGGVGLGDSTGLYSSTRVEWVVPHLSQFTPRPSTPRPFTPRLFTPRPFTPRPFTPRPFTPRPFTPRPCGPGANAPKGFERTGPERFVWGGGLCVVTGVYWTACTSNHINQIHPPTKLTDRINQTN